MRRIFVVLLLAMFLPACGIIKQNDPAEGGNYYTSKERQAVTVKPYDDLALKLLSKLQSNAFGVAATYQEAGSVDCARKKGQPIASGYTGAARICSGDGQYWLSGAMSGGTLDSSKIDAIHLPGLNARKDRSGVVGGTFTDANGKTRVLNPSGSPAEIKEADAQLIEAFKKHAAILG